MMPVHTQRLIIRNFTPDDWRSLKEIIIEKEASEYALYDHQFPTSDEEIKGITQWFAGGDAFLAVCLKPDNLIGYVALNKSWEETYDLGYCFHPDYHGNGYATEACSSILRYAFETLGASAVTSGTAEANAPSCRLLKRLGFQVTGESVGSFREDENGNPIEFKGLAYKLTNKEWASFQT